MRAWRRSRYGLRKRTHAAWAPRDDALRGAKDWLKEVHDPSFSRCEGSRGSQRGRTPLGTDPRSVLTPDGEGLGELIGQWGFVHLWADAAKVGRQAFEQRCTIARSRSKHEAELGGFECIQGHDGATKGEWIEEASGAF